MPAPDFDYFSDDDMGPPDPEAMEQIKLYKTPAQPAPGQPQMRTADITEGGDFFSDEDMAEGPEEVAKPENQLISGLLGAGDSLTFGYMDELGGKLGGEITSRFTGENPQTAKERITQRIRERMAAHETANPGSYFAGNVVGGAVGLGKIGAAAKALPRIGKAIGAFAESSPHLTNIVSGALAGGAYGSGSANDGSRLAGAARGGALGGAGGAILGGIGTKKMTQKPNSKEIPIPPRFLERPDKVLGAPDLETQATRLGKRHGSMGDEAAELSEKASQVLDKKNVQFPRSREPMDIIDRHEERILRLAPDGDETRLSPKMRNTLQYLRDLKKQIGPRQLPDLEIPDPSGIGIAKRTKTVKGELKHQDMSGRDLVRLRKQLDEGIDWDAEHTAPDRAVIKNLRHDFAKFLEGKGGAEYTREMRKAERRMKLRERLGKKSPKHENDFRKFEKPIKDAGKGNRAAQGTLKKFSQVTPENNFLADALDRQTKEEVRKIVNAIPESKGVVGKSVEAAEWVISPKARAIKAGTKKIMGDGSLPKLPKYPTEQSFGPDQIQEVLRVLSPRQRYIVERQLKSDPTRGMETLEKIWTKTKRGVSKPVKKAGPYIRARGLEHAGNFMFGGDE